MTQMLASVTDDLEAETVLRAGADIIDLKNPQSGALGALPVEQIHAIVDRVAERRPVSATTGDLPPYPTQMTDAIQNTAASGVNFVKVGFFSNENLHNCLHAIAGISANHSIIAVLFADRQPPLDCLSDFAEGGFRGIMLDTAEKQDGHLLGHIGLTRLRKFVEEARHLGLLSGLAGSLRLQDIPRLLPLKPDYLGFRGALCEHSDRVESINLKQVLAVRRAVSRQPDASSPSKSELVKPLPSSSIMS